MHRGGGMHVIRLFLLSDADKCVVGDNTFTCCNPWKNEQCKPISNGYSKCCGTSESLHVLRMILDAPCEWMLQPPNLDNFLADDVVCGDNCCAPLSRCYNSDGINNTDSCCASGSECMQCRMFCVAVCVPQG